MSDLIEIAVVDDEKLFVQVVEKRINNYLMHMNIEFNISLFTDGTQFIEACNNTYFDLIFLDIDMPEVTGLDIAHKLRMRQLESEMVFITNKDELVYDTIRYAPFRFIRKSRFEVEFEESLHTFLEKRKNSQASYLFSTDDGKKPVNVITILYIEVQSHKMKVHFKDYVLAANGNLSDVEKSIINYGFIRIHKSYLVNFRYINLINQKSVILDDGSILPLSRGKLEMAKKELMRLSRGV